MKPGIWLLVLGGLLAGCSDEEESGNPDGGSQDATGSGDGGGGGGVACPAGQGRCVSANLVEEAATLIVDFAEDTYLMMPGPALGVGVIMQDEGGAGIRFASASMYEVSLSDCQGATEFDPATSIGTVAAGTWVTCVLSAPGQEETPTLGFQIANGNAHGFVEETTFTPEEPDVPPQGFDCTVPPATGQAFSLDPTGGTWTLTYTCVTDGQDSFDGVSQQTFAVAGNGYRVTDTEGDCTVDIDLSVVDAVTLGYSQLVSCPMGSWTEQGVYHFIDNDNYTKESCYQPTGAGVYPGRCTGTGVRGGM